MDDEITIYRIKLLPGARFIRRPATILPEEGAICWIDNGTAKTAERYRTARFVDGRWCGVGGKPLASPPKFWTEMIPDA